MREQKLQEQCRPAIHASGTFFPGKIVPLFLAPLTVFGRPGIRASFRGEFSLLRLVPFLLSPVVVCVCMFCVRVGVGRHRKPLACVVEMR
jgi:hypothetical protein